MQDTIENRDVTGKKVRWYFRTSILIIAFLSVGPFALPLLWLNPRFSQKAKVIITVLVIVASYYLWVMSVNSWKILSSFFSEYQIGQ